MVVASQKFKISLETGATSYSAGKPPKYIISFQFYCSFSKNTQGKSKFPNCNSHSIAVDKLILAIAFKMCTSSEEVLRRRNVPKIAESIISMCSRTWSQERRIGILHESLEPRLSVWDCVPEHVIDAHLKDAVYEGQVLAGPSFADTCASLNISLNSATISSTTRFLVQRSCEVFAD